jgi:xanthine/uracil permease
VAERDEVVLVTTAARSPRDERRDRERRYLITMAVRVVAFIVAIVFARGWIRAVAVALALILPWVAVVAANAGPKRPPSQRPLLYSKRPPREIAGVGQDTERDSMSA